MALLIESPNVEYFKDLPHICEAARNFKSIDGEKLVEEIGGIFVKHNVYDDFGLTLLHRHFDMSEDEILVETFNEAGNISVALPWNVKGELVNPGDISTMQSYSLLPGKFVVPQTWAFSGTGSSLVAYEFLSYHTELQPPPYEFTLDLYAALKARGLESVFGIRRLLNLRDTNSWESTPEGVRANITHYGLLPPTDVTIEKMIKVVFAFDESAKLRCVAECRSCHNCNHCYVCFG